MLLALLSLIPVGLGLSLLAFGVPERRLLALTPRNAAGVAGVAVLAGPVALAGLGFVGWLVAMVALVAAVLTLTALRGVGTPPGAHR